MKVLKISDFRFQISECGVRDGRWLSDLSFILDKRKQSGANRIEATGIADLKRMTR